MSDLVKTEPDAGELQSDYGFSVKGMPLGLAIMFNDKLFDRVKLIAKYLSEADGYTPKHLIGKTASCFAIVTRSITWKLGPYAVMLSTYETPGGRIGFEGKLIQAILENSGRLIGPVTYEHFGPWDKINGKFTIKSGSTGKPYPSPTWTREDARGVGVIVRAQVRGEAGPRQHTVNLDEMFPLNSTLWATRPAQQICYTGARAFANIAAPGILMGEPFDVDHQAGEFIGATPPARPRREQYTSAMDLPGDVIDRVPTPAADPPHDAETGEMLMEQDAPQVLTGALTQADLARDAARKARADELPTAEEAWEIGRQAKDDGRALKASPGEWRTPEGRYLIENYEGGWRERDLEMKK